MYRTVMLLLLLVAIVADAGVSNKERVMRGGCGATADDASLSMSIADDAAAAEKLVMLAALGKRKSRMDVSVSQSSASSRYNDLLLHVATGAASSFRCFLA
jgi:hypothetical protein